MAYKLSLGIIETTSPILSWKVSNNISTKPHFTIKLRIPSPLILGVICALDIATLIEIINYIIMCQLKTMYLKIHLLLKERAKLEGALLAPSIAYEFFYTEKLPKKGEFKKFSLWNRSRHPMLGSPENSR